MGENTELFCQKIGIRLLSEKLTINLYAEVDNTDTVIDEKIRKKAIAIISNSVNCFEAQVEIKIWLTADHAKAIVLPIKPIIKDDGQKAKYSIFSYPVVTLMENITYFLEITTNNNHVLEQYRIKLSSKETDINDYIWEFPGRAGYFKLNFLNQLFYGDIEIWQNRRKILALPILVYPRKLKPDEAEKIIEELLNWHAEMIYDIKEPTGITLRPGEYGQKTPIQRLQFIKFLFDRKHLGKILNNIIENPSKKLSQENNLKEISDVETPECYLLPELAMQAGAVKKVPEYINNHFTINKNRYIYVKAYEDIMRITYDTYSNRFVKFFLKYLKQELNSIEEKFNSELLNDKIPKAYEELLRNNFVPCIYELKNKKVSRFLSREFFRDVSELKFFSSPPQILLKDYRYQEIFTAFLDLIRGLNLSDELEELLRNPVCNMPQLYEYWCFLRLWQGMEKIMGKGQFSKKETIGNSSLEYGRKITFSNKATLIYNAYYGKQREKYYSYSVGLRPDISLEIQDKLILFDAKYRIEWIDTIKNIIEETEEKTIDLKREERRGTFKIGDLYKMHTYREAIRRWNRDRAIWVIALYPGDYNELHLFSEDVSGEEKGNIKYPAISDLSIFLSKVSNGVKANSDLDKKLMAGGVGAIPLKP